MTLTDNILSKRRQTQRNILSDQTDKSSRTGKTNLCRVILLVTWNTVGNDWQGKSEEASVVLITKPACRGARVPMY